MINDDNVPVILTRADAEEIKRMIRWMKNLRGPGITNTPRGPSFHPPPAPRQHYIFQQVSAAPPLEPAPIDACPPPPPSGLRTIVVRLTAPEAGGGKYAGHLFSPNSTAGNTTNLLMPEGLTDTGNNNALILNLAENALGPAHRLIIGSYQVGLHVGYTGESTPRAIVLVQAAGPVIFPVQVKLDGGLDGAAGYPASWTYTVKTLDATVTLGTQVPLARPRPDGSMSVQMAGPAFGLAFFDATGELRLWDAGEVPAG